MLEPGLYDRLITRGLAAQLGAEARTTTIDDADQPGRLTAHVAHILQQELPNLNAEERGRLVGSLVQAIGDPERLPLDPPALLAAVGRPNSLGGFDVPERPEIPLGQHDLLVNARGEPQLAHELKKEIASADRIDLIVAFVRWYGVRLLYDALAEAIDRGATVRLLTTTYTGSTERFALDQLAELGVEVRVSYDTQVTRLHAKAWLFHRNTGYSTGYVGSSNITRSALLDGREWNVRISKAASTPLFEKVATAFEANWASADFESYDPERDAERLDLALGSGRGDEPTQQLSGLTVRPWPYQQEILDALESARVVHGSWRNLVVAPTGTGKTVVAALDYLRLRRERNDQLSLLFIAHREQILKQSRTTFREALLDGSFGELLVGGARPTDNTHVFASIQSLHAGGVDRIDPDAFDMVIVDEFHHAEAATYRAVLDYLQPKVLLALTATPERSDGLNIRSWTDDRTAFDMRLWHALDRQLLAPFQYFGTADIVDPDAAWARGAYQTSALGTLYSGNDARAQLVIKQVRKIIADPSSMKALGFCATVEHATFMAQAFTAAGIPAVALSGETPQLERERQIVRLRAGEIQAIFTRDIFNEGIDIPDVDTILLLRPTESATVFLQQIGRGLRRHPTKDVCTILDFIANYRKEFRFDLRLRALTGIARRDLVEAAEQDFPYLPTGSHLTLDRQSSEWVIQHLKTSVKANAPTLRKELQLIQQLHNGAKPTLRFFLDESGVELEDVAKAGGWTNLCRSAGLETASTGPDEETLQRGTRRLLHLDDAERIDALFGFLNTSGLPSDPRHRRMLWMTLVTIWSGKNAPSSLDDAWQGLLACPGLVDELRQTLPILRDRIGRVTAALPDDVPLHIGATYARDEILAAFGALEPGRYFSHQAGPWLHKPTNTEVFFITLRKTEKDYSPETMYRDFAMSPELFHWESQHKTTLASSAGQRYINQRSNGLRVLLAVREAKTDAWGATMPYVLLGPTDYVSHEGECPIALTWRLRTPIPAEVFERFKVAAA